MELRQCREVRQEQTIECGPCGRPIEDVSTLVYLSQEWLIENIKRFGSIYGRCPVCGCWVPERTRTYENRVRKLLGMECIKRARAAAKRPSHLRVNPTTTSRVDHLEAPESRAMFLFETLGDPRELRLDMDLVQASDYAVVADNGQLGGIWILRAKPGTAIVTGLEGDVITGRYFFPRNQYGERVLEAHVKERFTLVRTAGRDLDGVFLPFFVLQPRP